MVSVALTLKWPLEVGGDGRFITISGTDAVWASRLSQLMCARVGERVMRRDYGSEVVSSVLFENALFEPEESVMRAVQEWLPALTIEKVNVTKNSNSYLVEITAITPNGNTLTNSVQIGRNQ